MDVTIEIICSKCGRDLTCYQNTKGHIEVDICEDCSDKITKEAFDDGYDAGRDSA